MHALKFRAYWISRQRSIVYNVLIALFILRQHIQYLLKLIDSYGDDKGSFFSFAYTMGMMKLVGMSLFVFSMSLVNLFYVN